MSVGWLFFSFSFFFCVSACRLVVRVVPMNKSLLPGRFQRVRIRDLSNLLFRLTASPLDRVRVYAPEYSALGEVSENSDIAQFFKPLSGSLFTSEYQVFLFCTNIRYAKLTPQPQESVPGCEFRAGNQVIRHGFWSGQTRSQFT